MTKTFLSSIIFLLLIAVGCSHIKTKDQIQSEASQKNGEIQEKVMKLERREPLKLSQEVGKAVKTQDMVNGEVNQGPKVAVILGPGGVKTFSYVGALQVLDKNEIPIDAVLGMGWGSLVASLYAKQAKVHEVGWRLYKLRKDQFPNFTSGPQGVIPFLDQVFSSAERREFIKSYDVDFICPSRSIYGGSTKWIRHGKLETVLSRCLPSPPVFQSENNWVSSAFSMGEAINFLKKENFNVIIILNSLNQGNLFSKKETQKDVTTALYWQEIRKSIYNELTRVKSQRGVFVIDIKIPHVKLFEFEKRKTLEMFGKRAAKSKVEQIIREFDF